MLHDAKSYKCTNYLKACETCQYGAGPSSASPNLIIVVIMILARGWETFIISTPLYLQLPGWQGWVLCNFILSISMMSRASQELVFYFTFTQILRHSYLLMFYLMIWLTRLLWTNIRTTSKPCWWFYFKLFSTAQVRRGSCLFVIQCWLPSAGGVLQSPALR